MHKIRNRLLGLVCAISLFLSVCLISGAAVAGNTVTATTNAMVKQGNTAYCYVYIDSLENLAALDITVHYDSTKVKINNVVNSVSSIVYDHTTESSAIHASYIFDGKGAASKTRLFYFTYQVLSGAEIGGSYFDITVGEAYDSALNEVSVFGSRCKFDIEKRVTSKTTSAYSSSSVSTKIGQEFSLSYRFGTSQIASGTAVISYDPELFEVVSVTPGKFLDGKVTDINTDLLGAIYISFAGTEYASYSDLVTVTFRTLKNVTEKSSIQLSTSDLCDLDLNAISCSGYKSTVSVSFNNTYVGDAPKMFVKADFDKASGRLTANICMESGAKLGAGDFALSFDPEVLTLVSYTKGFETDFFTVNTVKAAEGQLKFYIVSLEDVVDAKTVLTLVFDTNRICEDQVTVLTLSGDMLTDSLVNPIVLNFIDGNGIVEKLAEHPYNGGIQTKAPTCKESGLKTYTCTICGDSYTEEIPKLTTHSYDGGVVTKTPTCAVVGIRTYTCPICGDSYTEEIPKLTTHSYNSGIVTKTPTCAEAGVKTITCTVCGDGYTEEIPKLTTHSYDSGVVTKVPTCAATGIRTYTCPVCGDSYTEIIPMLTTHSYDGGAITKPATCGETGVRTYTCTVCGDSYKEIIPKLTTHSYDSGVVTKQPTCKDTGIRTYTCAVCGHKKTEDIPKLDVHTYGQWVFVGNDLYKRTCIVCGHEETTSHNWNPGQVTKAATCKETGIMTYTCADCGFAKTEVLPKLTTHSYDSGVVTKAPTCGETGIRTFTCTVCAHSYTESISKLTVHNYNDGVITKPATCGETGIRTFTCTVCGVSYTEVVPKLTTHSYNSGVMTKAPTCGETGIRTFTCTICGDSYTEVIAKLETHSYNDGAVTREPTCDALGIRTFTCTVCGDSYTEIIPMLTTHSYNEGVVTLAPTCKETGVMTITCTVCGHSYTEEIAKLETHSYDGVETKAPTCAEAGVKTYTCTVCGDSYTEEIPQLTVHSYVDGNCTVCGAEDPDYVEPTDPTDPTEPTEPTEPNDGDTEEHGFLMSLVLFFVKIIRGLLFVLFGL